MTPGVPRHRSSAPSSRPDPVGRRHRRGERVAASRRHVVYRVTAETKVLVPQVPGCPRGRCAGGQGVQHGGRVQVVGRSGVTLEELETLFLARRATGAENLI